MKIREIDRKNYLKNSPLKRVVNLGVVLFVGATTAYGSYVVLYDPESLKSKINYALELFNFDKLTNDPAFRIKDTDKRGEPLLPVSQLRSSGQEF